MDGPPLLLYTIPALSLPSPVLNCCVPWQAAAQRLQLPLPPAHDLHLLNKTRPPSSLHPALHRQWYKFLHVMDISPAILAKLYQKQVWTYEQDRAAVKWQETPGIHTCTVLQILSPTETFWSAPFSLTSSLSLILIFTEIYTLHVVWECVPISAAAHMFLP